jgi:hypothetical protein
VWIERRRDARGSVKIAGEFRISREDLMDLERSSERVD